MSIAQETFEGFLKCPTKSYLYSVRAGGIQSESGDWQRQQKKEFKQTGWRRFRSTLRTGEWYEGTLPLQALQLRSYCLILDYKVLAHELHTRLHALELNPPVRHSYIPICFVPSEKLATSDKLLFAFDALALSRTFGKKPRLGKIIHGRQYVTVTVPLTGLLPKARSVLDRIADQRAEATPPPGPEQALCRMPQQYIVVVAISVDCEGGDFSSLVNIQSPGHREPTATAPVLDSTNHRYRDWGTNP